MPSQPATSKTENAPWKPAQPYYLDLYKKASEAFAATNGQKFTGSLYAGPTATQLQAQQMAKDKIPGMSTGVDELRNYGTSLARGDWLNPETNPYIADVASAAIRPVQQQFEKNLLSIGDRAISEGAYGGARQDIQQNTAVDEANRAMGDITSGIYYNNYGAERDRMAGAGSVLNQANQLDLAGAEVLAGLGAEEQGWNQKGLDAILQKWKMDQAAPWAGMSELSAILAGGGFGTSKSESKAEANPMMDILKALIGTATSVAGM